MMQSSRLNEHDAHQGAQSSGEFLGMSGNSGWYLLGSAGATIMMVIFLWGVLGVSLLLCLLVGLALCALSLAYVLVLKNNRPEHYDTDFFEAALVEAGVLPFVFSPRGKVIANPFDQKVEPFPDVARGGSRGSVVPRRTVPRSAGPTTRAISNPPKEPSPDRGDAVAAKGTPAVEPEPKESVSVRDYEQLQEQLTSTEELLEEAYADGGRHTL